MIAPLALRLATPADVPALHDLIERGYRGPDAALGWTHEADLFDGARSSPAALLAIIATPGEVILVHEDAGAIIGCVLVSAAAAGSAYVGMLCVDPRRQAGGLGGRLLAAAEAAAVERHGAARAEMTVIDRRTDLIAWYGRRGYRATGEIRALPEGVGQTLVPLALVVLAKDLTPVPA